MTVQHQKQNPLSWPMDVARHVLDVWGGMHREAARNIRRVHNYWITAIGYSSAIYTILGPSGEKFCFLVDASVGERVYLCMSKMVPDERYAWLRSPRMLVRAKLH